MAHDLAVFVGLLGRESPYLSSSIANRASSLFRLSTPHPHPKNSKNLLSSDVMLGSVIQSPAPGVHSLEHIEAV